jgi:hypothetical protein
MELRRVEYSEGGPINRAESYEIKTGLFHGWFQWQDGDDAGCLGTVEHEDGMVDVYAPEYIKFLDKPETGEPAT